MREKESKAFCVEKKNQKTLHPAHMDYIAYLAEAAPLIHKSFLVLLFKKERLPFLFFAWS